MNLRKDWWKIVLGIWMTLVILGAFLYSPRAKDLGESTRILFFHVPCAWVATIAFFTSAFYSIRYLRKHNIQDDMRSYSSAHLGLIFTVLATVTGAIWAAEIWGHPWNWDPRQTSIFILLLIYAAYFALRSAVDDEEKRARLAAVYSIIACVTVPFLMFIVPRVYESLHPDPVINEQGKIQMSSKMQHVFWSSGVGFVILFIWMFKLKAQILYLSYLKETEMENV